MKYSKILAPILDEMILDDNIARFSRGDINLFILPLTRVEVNEELSKIKSRILDIVKRNGIVRSKSFIKKVQEALNANMMQATIRKLAEELVVSGELHSKKIQNKKYIYSTTHPEWEIDINYL